MDFAFRLGDSLENREGMLFDKITQATGLDQLPDLRVIPARPVPMTMPVLMSVAMVVAVFRVMSRALLRFVPVFVAVTVIATMPMVLFVGAVAMTGPMAVRLLRLRSVPATFRMRGFLVNREFDPLDMLPLRPLEMRVVIAEVHFAEFPFKG